MKRRLLSFVLAFAMLLSVTPVAVFAAGTAVAKIGNTEYGTLAEALEAAADGATIELIWADGGAPIAMEGAVYGKTVTITGTATVDWSKGNLFVGRGGEGNGTVIFDGANLTSASNSSAYGIHVSGREKDTTDKYDGTLVIKNSTIELDYLINRGTITVDNSTLTVKNGFGIAGRPASETESGETATATINITNGSYVKVLNPNGMGVGVASTTPEGKGILNLTDSTFECASFNIDADLGDFNVYGTSTLKIATLTGREIDLQHNAIIKDSTVGGEVMLYGKVTFKGDNTFAMLYDYGAAYSADSAEWIVEKDASVTLTNTDRYGFGYGDKVTIYGNLTDALSARENLSDTDADVNMYGGLVGMTNSSYANTSMVFKVEDAYVIFGVEGDKSFGNKPGYYGSYQFDFDNSVITANGFKFYEDNGKAVFTFNKSDLLVNGVFMTNDADSKFTFTDSVIVSKATSNGSDDKNQNAGELILNNSSLTYNAPFTNVGTLTLDMASTLTAPEISGDGKIVIDATNYVAGAELIDADLSGFEGKVETVGNDNVTVSLENGQLVIKANVAKIGNVTFDTLQEAIDAAEAANTKDIVIDLVNNATLDITAWQTLAIGGEDTETITINGNGHTLVFNKKDSDWNHVITNNNAKLILNNMTLDDSGYNDGPWNRYDINFACDVELNDVVSKKALAFKADATLNTVTVNESGDNYAIWIQANGQTVVADGLKVNAENGRGIKIDKQYGTDAAKVNLTVTNADFTTDKKAAILVETASGADISVANVDISKVAADHINVVWVDEDAKEYFTKVTVNGGRAFIEPGVEGISYVSLGDSMTNGYGFTGYNQGNLADGDFYVGNGVYGERAYPNTFAKWLADKNGAFVHHARLGTSAMRAEDLYYLLGGREKPVDGWFDQVNYYTGVDDDAALAAFFQKEIANADVISMGVGNASFGAYLLQYVTDALGVMGGSLNEDEKVNLEMALIDLDPEQKELVLNIYNDLMVNMANYIPADLAAQYNVQDICDVLAYTTAGFLINYKGALERIVELNPDAEIILVGLMNTTYGMTITMPGMDPIPVGDFMDDFFGALNAYIAGLPTVLQASGKFADATFYYAELPNPRFISQEFDDLKAHNWNDVDGLSGAVVRERNIKAYNDSLRELISQAFSVMLPGGATLPVITLEMVNAPENYNSLEQTSVAIYLGIEDAVAASTETMEIPLSGLMKIAGDLSGVFAGVQVDRNDIRGSLYNALTANEEMKGMCKIYALFKVGNGMSVHPTPAAHDDLAAAVINAYENGFTAKDETYANIVDAMQFASDYIRAHYNEIYYNAWNLAKAQGFVDMANGYIDQVEAVISSIDYSALADKTHLIPTLDALKAEVLGDVDALRDLINNPNHPTAGDLTALMDELYNDLTALQNVAAQADIDAVAQLIALHKQIMKQYDIAYNQACTYICEQLGQAYDVIVAELTRIVAEQNAAAAELLAKYLGENPADLIQTILEYGYNVDAFINKWSYHAQMLLGPAWNEYGEDITAFVQENIAKLLSSLKAEAGNLSAEAANALLSYIDDLKITENVYAIASQLQNGGMQIGWNTLTELEAIVKGLNDQLIVNAAAAIQALEALAASQDAAAAKAIIDAAIAEIRTTEAERMAAIDAIYANILSAKAALTTAVDAINDLQSAAQVLGSLIENPAAFNFDSAVEAITTLLNELDAAVATVKAATAQIVTLTNDVSVTAQAICREAAASKTQVMDALYTAETVLENSGVATETLMRNAYAAAEAYVVGTLNKVNTDMVSLLTLCNTELQSAVNNVVTAVNTCMYNATHGEYEIDRFSKYVALGSNAAYADELAALLGMSDRYVKMSLTDNYLAEVAGADLVTVKMDNGEFLTFARNQIKGMAAELITGNEDLMKHMNNSFYGDVIKEYIGQYIDLNAKAQVLDWNAYLDARAQGVLKETLANVKTLMLEDGVPEVYVYDAGAVLTELLNGGSVDNPGIVVNLVIEIPVADLAVAAIENALYGYVRFANEFTSVLNTIHAVSPDAEVVISGIENPAIGMVLEIPGTQVNVGEYAEYVQYVVDALNLHLYAYALATDDTTYVEGNTAADILNALTVTKTGLLGDVNNDGKVSLVDAVLVLDYCIHAIEADRINVAVADVSGDGKVSLADAVMILDYSIKAIDRFPAEISNS